MKNKRETNQMNTMSSSANSIQSQSRPTSLYSIDQILGNNNTQQDNQSVFGKLNIKLFLWFGFENVFFVNLCKLLRCVKNPCEMQRYCSPPVDAQLLADGKIFD